VDSSVVLRIVLDQPGKLRSFKRIDRPFANEIIRLECLRTIDRARIRLGLTDEEVTKHRTSVLELLDAFDMVALDGEVLRRAEQPFPTTLGSLDAIHLATAVLLRDQIPELSIATHDGELALAAKAIGFAVEGFEGASLARNS